MLMLLRRRNILTDPHSRYILVSNEGVAAPRFCELFRGSREVPDSRVSGQDDA